MTRTFGWMPGDPGVERSGAGKQYVPIADINLRNINQAIQKGPFFKAYPACAGLLSQIMEVKPWNKKKSSNKS
jgi:hypothetical protein